MVFCEPEGGVETVDYDTVSLVCTDDFLVRFFMPLRPTLFNFFTADFLFNVQWVYMTPSDG